MYVLFVVFLFVILFKSFLFRGQDFGYECISPLSLLTLYILARQTRVVLSENLPNNHQCNYIAVDLTLKRDVR